MFLSFFCATITISFMYHFAKILFQNSMPRQQIICREQTGAESLWNTESEPRCCLLLSDGNKLSPDFSFSCTIFPPSFLFSFPRVRNTRNQILNHFLPNPDIFVLKTIIVLQYNLQNYLLSAILVFLKTCLTTQLLANPRSKSLRL